MADTKAIGTRAPGAWMAEDQKRPDGAQAQVFAGPIRGNYVLPSGGAEQTGVADVRGGGYLIRVEADNWAGGSAKLQERTLKGTWADVDATNLNWTADATKRLAEVGQGSTFRLFVTGAPVGLVAVMRGFS